MNSNSAMAASLAAPTTRYRNYVLGMLALSYAFSYMDRQIVSILLGDIKAEFGLNDTQLGLLSGLSFALFYSFLAIPIARYADRNNRVRVITIAITVWSFVTALCGAAQNFFQLFLGRMGVGVGEAGGLSPAHSVISDYFDEKSRPFAISIFSLGTALGAVSGLVLGGYVAETYGWRWAFVAAGAPGVLFALLFGFTVKEPVRGRFETQSKTETEKESFKETVKDLISNRPYMAIYLGHLLIVFKGYAFTSWLPEVLMRTYGLGQAEVGRAMGLIVLFGGAFGMFAGGAIATYFSRFDNRLQIRIPVVALIIALPLLWFALQQNNFTMAAILLAAGLFFYNMQHGPTLAMVQSCVKPAQRAQAASLVFFASNLLGLGLGPLFVGWISDSNVAVMGDAAALATALSYCLIVVIPAIFFFWRASAYLKKDSVAA